MARRIETQVATLLGTVDRVQKRVDWSVECPDCGHECPLTREQFEGEAASGCLECGWKTPRETVDPPRWYDYSLQISTRPPREQREREAAKR